MFKPLHDRVLVRRIEQDEKTKGEIIAVGSGHKAEDGTVTPLDVKAGDRVLFGKWSGTEVTLAGEELLIMKESDILGVIEATQAAKTKKAA